MELVDVLRHREPPRSEYFIENPTKFGKLRLDVFGPVERVMQADMVPEADYSEAARLVDQAHGLLAGGDAAGAEQILLGVARDFPLSPATGLSLFDFYWAAGRLDEAEYWIKQAIALDPSYFSMLLLARLLGKVGRLDEAMELGAHLWRSRGGVARKDALAAAYDYLITLGRRESHGQMLAVAEEAIAAYGEDSTLVYQQALALVMLRRVDEAQQNVEWALKKFEPSDPLYGRFLQMKEHIAKNFGQ